MQTYKVTLSVKDHTDFVCQVNACTKQRAIIGATQRLKAKLGNNVKVRSSSTQQVKS